MEEIRDTIFVSVNSPRNVSHHQRCLESSSPYFEPDIKVDLEWVNQRERPPRSLSGKYQLKAVLGMGN